MARDRTVTFRIPEALLSAALRAARAEEMTAGDFLRSAITERVAELGIAGTRDPVGTIRRALRRDFGSALDWPDLQRRLRAQKFVLRDVEGEIWLHTWPMEKRLVPLARLGVNPAELVLLYKAPFPTLGKDGKMRARAAMRAPKKAA